MANPHPMTEAVAPANTSVGTTSDDARWAAVLARDAAADGTFVTGVLTTGIYCRPSCPARHPKRQNVRFFDLPAQAEAAGLRACKRCKPNEPSQAQRHRFAVEEACRMIEQSEERVPLAQLATAVGLSQYHFHRVFKAITGITPKAYELAHRRERLEASLADPAGRMTDAIHDSGFGSSTRFYATASTTLGMTPRARRDGASGQRIQLAIRPCALGQLAVAATEHGICAVRFGEDPAALRAEIEQAFPRAVLSDGEAAFTGWVSQVVAQVSQPDAAFDLPLDIQGTAFQQQVWRALRDIPVGETRTYTDIAAAIGKPAAARAVANACGDNPVPVAVPCHRVVRADGSLGGYRGGTDRKVALLAAEGVKRFQD